MLQRYPCIVVWLIVIDNVFTLGNNQNETRVKYNDSSGRKSNNSSRFVPPPIESTKPITGKPKMRGPANGFDSDERSELDFDPEWCNKQEECGNMHVMCQFPNPGPSTNCVGYMKIPLTDTAIRQIIHYFNYRRNLVAGGKEYRIPSATNMRLLKWDNTLAVFAQRWADQCIYDPSILKSTVILGTLHDVCRDLPGFRVVQVCERVHEINSTTNITLVNVLHLLINTISSTIFNVTTHVLLSGYIPTEDFGAVAFHSQAYLIGCGIASYLLQITNHTQRMTALYCNLGPLNGVHLLDRYYEQGKPCSECPSGTNCYPDSYFEYLCQDDDSLDNPAEVYSSASDSLVSRFPQSAAVVILIDLIDRYHLFR